MTEMQPQPGPDKAVRQSLTQSDGASQDISLSQGGRQAREEIELYVSAITSWGDDGWLETMTSPQ